MDLYLCPLCNKKKAWASSTYPFLVVHNCQGPLVEVGSIFVRIETLKDGKLVKHKEYQPNNYKANEVFFKVKPVDSVDELKDCFNELELDKVNYFTGQSYYQNFPFWDKLWEYRNYKVLNSKDELLYLILLDHEYNFRQNATACMGLRGKKPSLKEAKLIIKACQEKKIPIKDEALSLRYIIKEFD